MQFLAAKSRTIQVRTGTNGTFTAQSSLIMFSEAAMRKFLEVPNWSPVYLNVAPHHLAILAECQACGQRREFDKRKVPPGLQHSLIREIEPLLKCSSCGARAGKLRFGSWAGD